MRYDILFLLFLLFGVLYILQRRKRSTLKAERRGIFDDCTGLLEQPGLTQEDINFPVLRGRYKGHEVTLTPIADNLAFRTIPSLWLLVSLHGKIPFPGTFDFLMRPKNIELYSPSSRLPIDLAIPEGWPQPAFLRTDNVEAMPPRERLEPHMSFFDDVRAKELLVTPRGIRLVYQAKQAQRSYYMLLRQVVFEDMIIPGDLVKHLLDLAVALYEDLEGGTVPAREKSHG